MHMQSIDQSEFDLLVLGTGLIESVVAAAAAKAGRSVLQLDQGSYYGGAWATLHLEELLAELQGSAQSPDAVQNPSGLSGVRLLRCPGAELGPSREYNIDLAPKALYGVGPMIALLLGSGAHHYTEFKLVQGSYLYGDGQLHSVPSSRAEVFRDCSLSPLQKRTLMRFLKACTDAMNEDGPLANCFDSRPFAELMQQERLDQQLQLFLAHGILLLQRRAEGITACEALQLLRRYIESAGRYAPCGGALLVPMYGCGELAQAFCRVAAVAGAVQVLRCPLDGLGFDEHSSTCTGVELGNGQSIRCRHVAGGPHALREWLHTFHPSMQRISVHRCVAVLDAPLRAGEQQTLVVMPPGSVAIAGVGAGNSSAVWGLALCHSTAVCPQRRWLFHMWTAGEVQADGSRDSDAYSLLAPALQVLVECSGLRENLRQHPGAEAADGETAANGNVECTVDEPGEVASDAERPQALFAAFYTTHTARLDAEPAAWPGNVAVCPGPGPEVTLSGAVEEAKQCYWKLFPAAASESFPLDPAPGAVPAANADSDEEAVEALQAALGSAAPEHEAAPAREAADGMPGS